MEVAKPMRVIVAVVSDTGHLRPAERAFLIADKQKPSITKICFTYTPIPSVSSVGALIIWMIFLAVSKSKRSLLKKIDISLRKIATRE